MQHLDVIAPAISNDSNFFAFWSFFSKLFSWIIYIYIYGGCEQSSVSSVTPDICVSLSNKTKPKRGFLNGELPVYHFKIYACLVSSKRT